jgi:nucleotide-binding universal stress UspA family protein
MQLRSLEVVMTENAKPYVIVAAVDYSSAGDLALWRALEEGLRRPQALVHVIHVLPVYQAGSAESGALGMGPPEGWVTALPSVTDAAEQLRQYTQRQVASFREQHGDVDLSFLDQVVAHQRVDVPSEEIARLARDVDADLVVVGTHGRRGLSRLLLGSVAEGTVRLAPCPVLVVRPKAEPVPDAPPIEPPCPRCLEVRQRSGGQELWCEQHHERHGQRHTYHQGDRRTDDANLPLVFRS